MKTLPLCHRRMRTSPVPVAKLYKLTDALDGDVWSYVEEKPYEDGTRLQSDVYRKSAGWTYEKVYAIAQTTIDAGANFVTITGYK